MMASTPHTSSPSEQSTDSARTRSRVTRSWESDEEYIKDQDEISSWSSQSSTWGEACASKFAEFGISLGDQLYHDDKVADFGGNDGYAAFNFYLIHKIKPMVVDCEPKRIANARDVFKMPVYQTFIESMPELSDKSIDWAFSSHTLEHTRDTGAALREIARVTKRGACFVLPLEDMRHAKANHAHAICFNKSSGWIKMLESNGWTVKKFGDSHKHEVIIFAEPK